MGNPEKNKKTVNDIVRDLEGIARGDSRENFEYNLSRLYHIFSSGFCPEPETNSDYVRDLVRSMEAYCSLIAQRRIINFNGASREMATETEALASLKHASRIAHDFLLPHLTRRFDFA